MMHEARRALRMYQRDALYYSLRETNPAFFLDMRLGKTLITIRSICIRIGGNFKVLIFCPNSAIYSWTSELTKEGFTDRDFIILDGATAKERRSKLRIKRKFYIINSEGWLALPELGDMIWDAVVVDESDKLSAPPKVNRSARGIRPNTSKYFEKNFRNVKHRYILTGTEMPESELDIFQQLRFLDPSILPFDNFYSFRNALFIKADDQQYYISERGKKYLSEKLAARCFFLSRKEVNLGGEKIYERRHVILPKEIRDIYRQMLDNYAIVRDGKIIDVTDFAVARFVWARQLCGGFLVDKENNKTTLIWDGKINAVIQVLESQMKKIKVVIWSEFTHEIRALADAINTKTKRKAETIFGEISPVQRQERVNDFFKSKYDTLICQSKCFQYGADLSCADVEIFYSTPLALKVRKQCEDRLISVNSSSTLVLDFAAENTLEEDMLDAIERKETNRQMMRRIIDRLQKEKKKAGTI